MPNSIVNGVGVTSGLLINNPSPLPDGSVGNPNVQTMSAAGTNQATAAALTAPFNLVAAASGTNGVALPVGTINQQMLVYPSAATNALLVYPPLGGTINSGAANASASVSARKCVEFRAIDTSGLNWVSIGL